MKREEAQTGMEVELMSEIPPRRGTITKTALKVVEGALPSVMVRFHDGGPPVAIPVVRLRVVESQEEKEQEYTVH